LGIREKMNEKQGVIVCIASAIIVGAAIVSILKARDQDRPPIPSRAFYTVDDGKTFFVDDINNISPFEHDGRTAYRCYVFSCDGGKTKFVGRLERYTSQGKAEAEDLLKHHVSLGMPLKRFVSMETEIKAPGSGDTGWLASGDPRATSLLIPRGPDGSTTNITAVVP
jgi:hypothetical protein